MQKPKKDRIDNLLVHLDLAENTDEAARFIMAGLVVVDDHRADKPGQMFPTDSVVRLKAHNKFASRGGLKLEKAAEEFQINFDGKTVIDIGASTGGFTDVALKAGAAKVFAVDTGKGQLDPRLTRDERVTVLDATNFRTIPYETINAKADIFVCDVSFISLSMIIPSCVQFCAENAEAAFLIKPQFEAEKIEVGRGGIVFDRSVHERVIKQVIAWGAESGFGFFGLCTSPIRGAKGNIEYLVHFRYNIQSAETDIDSIVNRVVYENHSYSRQTAR
jgi:23S rRNA (cytidine1920-2'-O)/16S rRNA (cytidine1409-2'-O)-methyltransferase